MLNTNIKVCFIFPYTGYNKGSRREELFWRLTGIAQKIDPRPVIVINEDTCDRGQASAFFADPRQNGTEFDIIKVWSVDTCQMWLHGWGHIFDHYPNVDRIVQLPGDIDYVEDESEFTNILRVFITHSAFDIVIGDFKISDRFGAKMLIDEYGTYPLLSNWFPQLTQAIFELSIFRPRSEFLNFNAQTLRDLLRFRKFAYEQTLNILISAWDFEKNIWRYEVSAFSLGSVKDDSSQRQFLATLDQIERTERLIKLRWREIYLPLSNNDNYAQFLSLYNKLDRHSTAVREAAGITIQALLGLRPTTLFGFTV